MHYAKGIPEIVNAEQGTQFTAGLWIHRYKEHNIKISMDGKGRVLDCQWIAFFRRTVKYNYIYLYPMFL
jgi:putative transposase